VALQGTLALFSIHGVLGFESSMRGERERGTVFLFIIIFFLFYLWGLKNGLQQMPPLYNTYRAMVLRRKFYKINKTELPKLILSKLDQSEILSLQQFPFNTKQ
jgi:hypothetical protein